MLSTTCHEMDGGQCGAERRAVRGKVRGDAYLGIPTCVYAALGSSLCFTPLLGMLSDNQPRELAL